MLKFAGAALVAAVVVATPAAAQRKPDPRISAALSCASITDSIQRLRCYDTAITGLRQALDAGRLVSAAENKTPFALEGTIRQSGHFGFNRFWMELSNGDRWNLVAANRFDVLPKRGAKVTIRKAPLGGYWVQEQGSSNRRGTYLGR